MAAKKAPAAVLIHDKDNELSMDSSANEDVEPIHAVNYRDIPYWMDKMRTYASGQEPDKKRLKTDWREKLKIGEAYENIALNFQPY